MIEETTKKKQVFVQLNLDDDGDEEITVKEQHNNYEHND